MYSRTHTFFAKYFKRDGYTSYPLYWLSSLVLLNFWSFTFIYPDIDSSLALLDIMNYLPYAALLFFIIASLMLNQEKHKSIVKWEKNLDKSQRRKLSIASTIYIVITIVLFMYTAFNRSLPLT